MSLLQKNWELIHVFWNRDRFGRQLFQAAFSFLILVFLSFGICLLFPDVLSRIMEQVFDWFQQLQVSDSEVKLSAAVILSNNVRACITTICCGCIPFLYLSAFSMGINAMLLGVMAAYYVASGHSLLMYALAILPHGIFEIPALVLSFSLGLYLCRQVSGRLRSLSTAMPLFLCLRQISRVLLLLVVPLLTVAAVIEAHITPALLAAAGF